MSTLVARLAGPLQAWGAEPRLRTASTHPTPTWSGLLGIARAALGHGRTDPTDQIRWLRNLDMAIRVDQPGTVHVDFHTINPLPAAYEKFEFLDPPDRGLVPLGTTVQASGQAPRWLKGAAPLVTRRAFINDGSFLWLAHGPDGDLDRLAHALSSPRWTLALGRKGCTPASPFLLGLHPGTITQAARAVPLTGRTPDRTVDRATIPGDTPTSRVELVWIHGAPDPALAATGTRVLLDNPTGSHPQDGYTTGRHTVTQVQVPYRKDLLQWASAHLTHPARTSTDLETTT